MRIALAILVLLAPAGVSTLAATDSMAQSAATDAPLRVLLRVAPPFVIDEGDGNYAGISVDLWRQVAEDLQLTYRFEVTDLEAMLDAVAAGRADVGVGATTVTAAREARLDFLHPFLSSGLAIAARTSGSAWTAVLQRVLSLDFVRAVGALAILLLGVGLLVWIFERRRNPEQFEVRAGPGLWSAFWFAAVTMTTVGYGDKSPRSVGGRIVALVWMFASIIVISFFTASIATALTVQSLARGIEGPEDLPGLRAGAVRGTTGQAYLDERAIEVVGFDTTRDAVRALARDEIDAVVHDAPILLWAVRDDGDRRIEVLPGRIARQDYAFVLPPGSPRRDTLNRALLRAMESSGFARTLEFHLGR